MGIPLAVDRARRGTPAALAWAAAVVVMGAGLLVTTSRSGGLGVLAGCLALIVFTGPRRFSLAIGAGAASVVGIALFVLLASPLAGYSAWVLFTFDWAPATGAFWLLAGALWSAVSAPPDSLGGGPKGRRGQAGRSIGAVGLVLAAIVFAVFPVLADVWYLKGRADLAVKVDPLQAQYHWALGGIEQLRQAAALGETEPGFYVTLGDRELGLGNRTRARDAYRRALEIDPYYSPAAQRLSALGG